jgi:hypothetical protein
MTGKKLFAVYVGGDIEGSQIELHDMRFVAGKTIEDCYDDLKSKWWGRPQSLHLDAWGAVEWADGYAVDLADEPATDGLKLWFLNLGGYDQKQFTELHHNVFKVAPDWRTAKQSALKDIADWFSPHKDTVFEIENVVDVAAASDSGALHVRLTPDPTPRAFKYETRYVPIGKMT